MTDESRRLCCSVSVLPCVAVTENRSHAPACPNTATVMPVRKPQEASLSGQPAPAATVVEADAAGIGDARVVCAAVELTDQNAIRLPLNVCGGSGLRRPTRIGKMAAAGVAHIRAPPAVDGQLPAAS